MPFVKSEKLREKLKYTSLDSAACRIINVHYKILKIHKHKGVI